jgi:hypothetical protein
MHMRELYSAVPMAYLADPRTLLAESQETAKMFRIEFYPPVSAHDQQTGARFRGTHQARLEIAAQNKEIGSHASERKQRERLSAAARRRGDFPNAFRRLLAQKFLSP